MKLDIQRFSTPTSGKLIDEVALNEYHTKLKTMTGDLSDLETSDQSSLVNAINEINVKNQITMQLSGAQSFSNQYTKLNLTPRTIIGTKLSVSSNQVLIGAGVNYIKVSATLGYNYVNAGLRYLRITKNYDANNLDATTIAMQINYETTTNKNGTISITDVVIPVNEGDLIGMYVYGLSGDSARYTLSGVMLQTNMTVETVTGYGDNAEQHTDTGWIAFSWQNSTYTTGNTFTQNKWRVKDGILYIQVGAGQTSPMNTDTETEIARIPITGNTSFNSTYTRVWNGAVGGGGATAGFMVMQNTDYISVYMKPHKSTNAYAASWYSTHFTIPLDSTSSIL